MPKNNQNNDEETPGKGKGKKPPRKGAGKRKGDDEGNKTYKDIRDKAKKSKRKTVKVLLPAVIAKKEFNPDEDAEFYHSEDQMSEDEISYKDALLAVEMEKLARKGLTNDAIIAALGMSRDTFYRKLREEPYFSYALTKHQGIALQAVESALHMNAVGFKYKEEQGTSMGDVVTVEKYKLPETRAQEIILYNRRREEWSKIVEPKMAEVYSISNVNIRIKRRID